MSDVPVVRVIRSGVEESVHVVDVAVAAASGRLIAFAGDPDRPLFARSSMKPLQASVSLSFAAAAFEDREVAVMCSSHNGEPVHLEAVRSVLARAGVPEAALQTPAVRPMEDEARAAAPERLPINSDCSGKHAGMLAAAHSKGWPLQSYRTPRHPLQQAIHEAVTKGGNAPPSHVGVDGCGVPVHRLPLRAMATIFARLGEPQKLGSLAPHAARAIRAMRAQPYLVAGRGRLDTAVMQATENLVVKGGAEGLSCAAVVGGSLGIAVRVRDGSSRATGPALLRILELLELLEPVALETLTAYRRPPVLGGGEPVGELVADFALRN